MLMETSQNPGSVYPCLWPWRLELSTPIKEKETKVQSFYGFVTNWEPTVVADIRQKAKIQFMVF